MARKKQSERRSQPPSSTRAPFRISRRTVRSTDEGEQPRTLRELRVLQALGAILNKRAWWIKWTTRPEVRAKWLQEIEDALVSATVSHIWALWPDRGVLRTDYEERRRIRAARGGRHPRYQREEDGFDGTRRLLQAARMADPTEKAAEIERLLADVMYPPCQPYAQSADNGFKEGTTYESDGDEEMEYTHEDDGDGFLIETTDFDAIFRHHQKKDSFGQIAWYVAMCMVREQLRLVPPADWTTDSILARVSAIWSPENHEVITRACQLISSVVGAGPVVTMQTLRSHLPWESRPNVLKLLHYHFTKIRFTLETATQTISGVLELAIQKLKLQGATQSVDQPVYLPGPAPQTWLSDTCIPTELKRKFAAEIATLESVPDDMKDWHPNSKDQVLNLVHPSLFCGVVKRYWSYPVYPGTALLPESAAESVATYSSVAAHMNAIMFALTPRTLKLPRFNPSFQWLPCEIDVAESGDAAVVRTYINNLHPEDHSALYDSIGAIFARFVPLFDHVLSSLDDSLTRSMPECRYIYSPGFEPTIQYQSSMSPGNGAKQFVSRCLKEETDAKPAPLLCCLAPPTLFEVDKLRFSLKGKRCQVIVKIAEIVLTPEKPEYAGGSWHVEGTESERIIVTGLYYFGCDNITESRLSFRTVVDTMPEKQSDQLAVPLNYGVKHEDLAVQTLGSVTAMEDRCVVFPNLLHHKVEPFRLADPTKPGVRKILAFFLVDPTGDPIPSTAVAPPQQKEWVERALKPLRAKFRLPDVAVDHIIGFSCQSMSREEARAFRLELMEERSAVQLYNHEHVTLSLCEH